MQFDQPQASSESDKNATSFSGHIPGNLMKEVTEDELFLHVFVWRSTSSRVQESSLCSTGDLDCIFSLADEVFSVIFVYMGSFQVQEKLCFLMCTNQLIFTSLAGVALLKLAISLS